MTSVMDKNVKRQCIKENDDQWGWYCDLTESFIFQYVCIVSIGRQTWFTLMYIHNAILRVQTISWSRIYGIDFLQYNQPPIYTFWEVFP